jgi:hypothetical protein
MFHKGTYLFKTGFAIYYNIDEYISINVAYKMLIHASPIDFVSVAGSVRVQQVLISELMFTRIDFWIDYEVVWAGEAN